MLCPTLALYVVPGTSILISKWDVSISQKIVLYTDFGNGRKDNKCMFMLYRQNLVGSWAYHSVVEHLSIEHGWGLHPHPKISRVKSSGRHTTYRYLVYQFLFHLSILIPGLSYRRIFYPRQSLSLFDFARSSFTSLSYCLNTYFLS